MNVQNPFCNPQTVGQFLADQLSDLEQAAFEAHLNGCAECQERLESTAAEGSWWSDARAYLASSDSSPGATGTSDWPPSDNNADERQAATLFGLKNYLAPTDDPRMLGRVGAYEIPGIIGSGGMGVVLKGFDPALNRYVAIKIMAPSLASSGAARRRFAREAQAAAAVVHDNVMAIHAVAETQGLPYLVMPYVRGASLDQRLRAKGPLAIEEVLRIAFQVAAGLAAAHAQGLIHRDIKPANILLEDGVERVKITDFGLARAAADASLTGSGAIAGTPQYMSPEQASGEAMDHRSDLFSLGSVIYAMCTGRPPFRAETSYGVLRRICESEPRAIVEVNSAIPSWLARLVGRLHEKNPSRRFASATELAALLERCLAHVQQPNTVALPAELTEAPVPRPTWGRFPTCHKKLSGARLSIFVALASLAIIFVVSVLLLKLGKWAPPLDMDDSPETPRPAMTAGTSPSTAWQDGIADEIESLDAGLGKYEAEFGEWHDGLADQIDNLSNEVRGLEAGSTEGTGSLQEPREVEPITETPLNKENEP
ncbi:MAG TPA: protein kinase [Pirellulales bacterium]|nr:protein kinase [Pirellulales bacterium]